MRIAIFGTGGVGGYFGGRLAQAGEDVIFIARGSNLEAMQRHGLRVQSINGDFTIQPVQATKNPAEVGKVDAVLVCVKAWQVADAARAMRPMIGPHTVVLPLQNGVEAAEHLARTIDKRHILGGFCYIFSFMVEPGVIQHAGIEPRILLNELDNQPTERVENLRRTLEHASITVEVADDIHTAMWQKFIFIAATSALGSITRMPFGMMRGVPETRHLLEQAVQEAIDVGLASNIGLPADTFARIMKLVDSIAPDTTTSMQRDVMTGRLSELEAQSGAVVRLGKAAGMPTPLHAFVYGSLLPMELHARGRLPPREVAQ